MSGQGDGESEVQFARSLSAGEPEALRRFEGMLAGLDRVLGSMKLDAASLDEVRQRVRTRLLVPDEQGAVRITRYAGQGRLEGLVHVTASRIAVDLVRARRADHGADADATQRLADGDPDPLLAAMKQQAGEHFRRAFARAVDALDDRESALLKLHLLRGVTLERLAEMYSVHRATVVRWLSEARAKVLAGTRKELSAQLGARELDEVLGLLESQLDASVERLFRTRG
jgi:RNA polymerase sigma-70 factor (ECF subfamily)